MIRSLALLIALALAPAAPLCAPAQASERALPMRFDLYRQNPADACGARCRVWIGASGAITADTPRDFTLFAHGRDLRGLTVALDSDGGSVLGAIGLGREIRKLALNTTVGRSIDLDSGDARAPYASLSPRADCQSMCAFVLLAGVQRTVPREARVMVHQIWLGDRREDPTAANYSAEDLVLVQHDIGSLAQYTIEMGASIDLLNLSLRIPPWEPMHMLTASEISRMHVATDLPPQTAPATVVASPPAAAAMAPLIAPVGTALQPTAISEYHWAVVDHAGTAALARRNPLTIEGEEIGSFDLIVACGGPGTYDVSYAERRHADAQHPMLEAVSAVTMTIGKTSAPLKVVSSQRRQDPDELVTFASATLPASIVAGFAAAGNHSLMIETASAVTATGIRVGNTGAPGSLPRLAARCAKPLGDRAELSAKQIGGVAVK
jgi:hypothetical protein